MKKFKSKICIIALLFVIFSFVIAGGVFYFGKNTEPKVCVTVSCDSVQIMDFFVISTYKQYRKTFYTPGESMTLEYCLEKPLKDSPIRIDFGMEENKLYKLSEVSYYPVGFYRYRLSPERLAKNIFQKVQMKEPVIQNGVMYVETTGSDSFFITNPDIFSNNAKPEFFISANIIYTAVILELILVLTLVFFMFADISGIYMFLKKHKNFIINFTIGNILLFSGVAVFYFHCDQKEIFTIRLKSSTASTIQITKTDYSKQWFISYTTPGKYQDISLVLPTGTDASSLRIDFGYEPQSYEISDIYTKKHVIFRKKLDLRKAENVYYQKNHIDHFKYKNNTLKVSVNGIDGYIIPQSQLYNKNVYTSIELNFFSVALLLFELMLIVSPCVIKKDTDRKIFSWNNLGISAITAFTCALYLTLIIPFQTYLSNLEIFDYSWQPLLKECTILFCFLFFSLFVLLFILRFCFARLLHLMVLFTVLYFFLESGVLSIGLPQLDGYADNYLSMPRSVIDTLVLFTVLLIPIVFYQYISRYLVYIALAIIILAGATLLDVKIQKEKDSSDYIINTKMLRSEVVKNVKYAQKNNVILLIIDSTTTEVVQDAFREVPELAKIFNGFVHYTNNVGMHIQTSVAIPGLMTGLHFTKGSELANYTETIFKKDSLIKPYLDSKIPVFVNIGLSNKTAYTNAVQILAESNSKKENPLLWRAYGLFQWNLVELCFFRLTPYHLKRDVLINIMGGWKDVSFTKNISNEQILYSMLGQAPVDNSYEQTLQVHHSSGSHPPFYYGSNGEKYDNPVENNYVNYKKQTIYIFKLLAKLMEYYKRIGIYDSSVIIVCGDHGIENSKIKNYKIPRRALPMLLIKPSCSAEPFKESKIPTSHSKIADLVKKLEKQTLSQKEIEQILYQEKRLYRIIENNRLYDWFVFKDQSFELVKRDEEPEKPENLKPMQLGKTYLFRSFDNKNYPDFIVKNGVRTSGMGLDYFNNNGSLQITFKVPEPDTEYEISLEILASNITFTDSTLNFSFGENSITASDTFKIGVNKTIVIKGAKSDSKGILTITVDNPEKKRKLVTLMSICFK